MKYQSNLVTITDAVNKTKTIKELKQVLTDFITGNKLFAKDEVRMLYSISQLKNHTLGLFFFYNNILKYEKLGVA